MPLSSDEHERAMREATTPCPCAAPPRSSSVAAWDDPRNGPSPTSHPPDTRARPRPEMTSSSTTSPSTTSQLESPGHIGTREELRVPPATSITQNPASSRMQVGPAFASSSQGEASQGPVGVRRPSASRSKPIVAKVEPKPVAVVVRYLPLDVWVCTSLMDDTTIEEAKYHCLTVAGLLPPQSHQHDLVPSFDARPRRVNSIFGLLAKPPAQSVVVARSQGLSYETQPPRASTSSTSRSESVGEPSSTDLLTVDTHDPGNDTHMFQKLGQMVRPSTSKANLRRPTTLPASPSSAEFADRLSSVHTKLPSSAAGSRRLQRSTSSAAPSPGLLSPSRPTRPGSTPAKASSSSVATSSSLLSDASAETEWSFVEAAASNPSSPAPKRGRPAGSSTSAFDATADGEADAGSASLTSTSKIKSVPLPPGIVIDSDKASASHAPSLLKKPRSMVEIQASAKGKDDMEHETKRILDGHDLVLFSSGFLLDKRSIKNLRAGDLIEVQLRASYINLSRSDTGSYLRSCFQSWAWVSAHSGGATKQSMSNDSVPFRRRWVQVEGGELVGRKTIEDTHGLSAPIFRYPLSSLLSLAEYDAPKVSSKALHAIPAKSILVRFSDKSDGQTRVETGQLWIRSQSLQAHVSLVRALTFAASWSAQTQSAAPTFSRGLVYLQTVHFLSQPAWRLKHTGQLPAFKSAREEKEWERWTFTPFDRADEEPLPPPTPSRTTRLLRRGTVSGESRIPHRAGELWTKKPASSVTPLSAGHPATASSTSLASFTTSSTHSLPASSTLQTVVSAALHPLSSLASATLRRARSSSSDKRPPRGHRRRVSLATERPVVDTAVDASGEEVYLIDGSDGKSSVVDWDVAEREWSRRMRSVEVGQDTIRARSLSTTSRTSSTAGTSGRSQIIPHSSRSADSHLASGHTGKRPTITAAHFQSPAPTATTLSSSASTSTASLRTPSSHATRTASGSSTISSSSSVPTSPTPKSPSRRSIPVPFAPQHRRHDSSSLVSILSTSPRSSSFMHIQQPKSRAGSQEHLHLPSIPILPLPPPLPPSLPSRRSSASSVSSTGTTGPPPPSSFTPPPMPNRSIPRRASTTSPSPSSLASSIPRPKSSSTMPPRPPPTPILKRPTSASASVSLLNGPSSFPSSRNHVPVVPPRRPASASPGQTARTWTTATIHSLPSSTSSLPASIRRASAAASPAATGKNNLGQEKAAEFSLKGEDLALLGSSQGRVRKMASAGSGLGRSKG